MTMHVKGEVLEQALSVLGDTVPRYWWRRVQERGDKIAMREKDLGIWKPITWRQYGERARAAGLGFVALGLQRGEVVSVIAENNPEWLYTDLGTQGVGGICNGVYTTDSAKQVDYILNDSKTRIFVVEDEEQLDKALEVRERVPSLTKIVVIDMDGLHHFSDPMVMSFDDLLRLGEAYHRDHPTVWEEQLALGQSDDTAILIYTSGTTGPPKGAMIAHSNLLFQVENTALLADASELDEQLSFLPLCHIAERANSVLYPLRSGAKINFAESLETVAENFRELQPTVMLAVPRFWERFYSGIVIRMREATLVGKWAYKLALGIGSKAAERRLKGEPVDGWLGFQAWLANKLVLGNIRRAIGVDRARYLFTGAAPISPDLIRWYLALGCDMREVYGQTENVGLATAPPPGQFRPGYVGKVVPNTEVRISAEGEILLKGPHVFKGYLNNPEKTAETIVDGWLHTGDVGHITDDGWVKITDRMKDIIITAGGKNITPSEIENQLKFSPYISDAVVIGDRRPYLVCLVMIDYENVAKFAQDQNIPFTNFASLCQTNEVKQLIEGEIEQVNKNFARVETIKKFRLIEQELTAEDDELTPTMKLKRKFVNQKYKDMIDGMYAAN